MLRVVAVDDEPSALADLARRIAGSPRLRLVGTADSPAKAKKLIVEAQPDAAFLDVEMPGGDAFSLLAGLDKSPKIVFVTAHSRHALPAFDVEAVDFLVKPLQPDRFALAARRLERAVALEKAVSDLARRSVAETTITVTGHREKHVVRASEIRLLTAEGDYARLHVARGGSILASRSLGEFERQLPSPPFLRLDRSTMVNLARVAGLLPLRLGKVGVKFDDRDDPVVLGRSAAAKLRRFLTQAAGSRPTG